MTMEFRFLILSASLILCLIDDVRLDRIQCNPDDGMDLFWRRDPQDCATAYLCVFGRKVEFTCPELYVISGSGRYCVPAGTDADDCTGLVLPEGFAVIWGRDFSCKVGETSPVETNCAKYSECVVQSKAMSAIVIKECPYPLLYDPGTGKCENYAIVKCAEGQFEPKSPCDYEANQCTGSHCVPCSIMYPSCSGQTDGKHAWAGREWSPYYVICDAERVTYQGQCKTDKDVQMFHPGENECVAYDEKVIVG